MLFSFCFYVFVPKPIFFKKNNEFQATLSLGSLFSHLQKPHLHAAISAGLGLSDMWHSATNCTVLVGGLEHFSIYCEQ
jgi:hypothetical protein